MKRMQEMKENIFLESVEKERIFKCRNMIITF